MSLMPLPPPRWGLGGRSKAPWGGGTAPFITLSGLAVAAVPAPPPRPPRAPGVPKDRWCRTFHSKGQSPYHHHLEWHHPLRVGDLPGDRNFRYSADSSWSLGMEIAPELLEGGKPLAKEINIFGEQGEGKIEPPREWG